MLSIGKDCLIFKHLFDAELRSMFYKLYFSLTNKSNNGRWQIAYNHVFTPKYKYRFKKVLILKQTP